MESRELQKQAQQFQLGQQSERVKGTNQHLEARNTYHNIASCAMYIQYYEGKLMYSYVKVCTQHNSFGTFLYIH